MTGDWLQRVIYVEYHTFPEHSFYDTRFHIFEDEIFNKFIISGKKMQQFINLSESLQIQNKQTPPVRRISLPLTLNNLKNSQDTRLKNLSVKERKTCSSTKILLHQTLVWTRLKQVS